MSLSQPVEREKLYLYLVASVTVVNATLVWLGPDSKKRSVYFVSKVFSEVETMYTHFKRVVLALRIATEKLRPYFQAHTIIVLTGSLIKAILHKLDVSRRLLKWAIELIEFAIEYRPRSAIKG